MPLLLEDIQAAVCAWHNRHPLAARIGPDAVHSVGWVALPYMKPAQAQEPSLDAAPSPAVGEPLPPPRWRLWPRRGQRGAGPWPVFSETFIDGLRPRRVAAFAAQHAWSAAPADGSAWPQRRIEVNSALAEACPGAWPTEHWLVAAAVDHQGQRLRVLVGEQQGRLAVLAAQRHWERPRLAIAAALLAFAVAALSWLLWPGEPKPAAAPAPAASAPASSAVPAAIPASSSPAASAAEAAASAPAEAASAPPEPAAVPSSVAPVQVDAGPVPDIRPRLGPVRRSPRAALQAQTAQASAAADPPNAPGTAASPPAASAPYGGARNPEQLRLRALPSGPQVALVSPGFANQAEAEAQLERMRLHVRAVVSDAALLQAEVFETPQGWRAAVWPFATREEAQIVNATMVARGWKTRAVDF